MLGKLREDIVDFLYLRSWNVVFFFIFSFFIIFSVLICFDSPEDFHLVDPFLWFFLWPAWLGMESLGEVTCCFSVFWTYVVASAIALFIRMDFKKNGKEPSDSEVKSEQKSDADE